MLPPDNQEQDTGLTTGSPSTAAARTAPRGAHAHGPSPCRWQLVLPQAELPSKPCLTFHSSVFSQRPLCAAGFATPPNSLLPTELMNTLFTAPSLCGAARVNPGSAGPRAGPPPWAPSNQLPAGMAFAQLPPGAGPRPRQVCAVSQPSGAREGRPPGAAAVRATARRKGRGAQRKIKPRSGKAGPSWESAGDRGPAEHTALRTSPGGPHL